MITTIVVVLGLITIAVLAFFIRGLAVEYDSESKKWSRAVERKEEQIAVLEEQLLEAESQARQAKNVSLNLSRERDEMRAIGSKLETENKRLEDNLTAWVEKYDRLQAKVSELCEVLK